MAFSVLKYLGVGYLLFLAWRTLRDRSPLSVDAAPAPRSDARVIGQSGVFMLVTLIVFAGYGLFAAAVRTARDQPATRGQLDAASVRRLVRGAGQPARARRR